MQTAPTAGTEFARNAPLTAGAIYLNFISQYGAAIVTTLAIVYGVLQIVRWGIEMKDRKERKNVSRY